MKQVLLVLVLAATAATQLTTEQKAEKEGCRAGYTPLGDRCFKINKGTTYYNWAGAKKECQKVAGGNLLSFSSYEEMTQFYTVLGRYDRVWIGLEHPVRHGGFRWSDGTAVGYTRFTSSSYDLKRGTPGPFSFYQAYMSKSSYTSTNTKYACQIPRAGASQKACGETFTKAMSGNFSSPNYPSYYNDNDFCRWSVEAPTNHTLTVTMHDFDTELHRDILDIYTSTSLHAIFQGYYPTTPITFTVDSDVLAFVWKTDPIDNKNTGFDISFKASDCPKLWNINQGQVSYSGVQAGATATFKCIPGFVLNGTAMQTCGVGGWSDPVPRCERMYCPRLVSPDHGSLSTLNRYGYQFEGQLKLICDVGFRVNDLKVSVMVRNCTDDGVWEGPALKCLPVNCGLLPTTTTRKLAKVYGSGTRYGTIVRTSCVYGVRTGNAERTCQANGLWSGIDVYCNEAVTCDFKYHSCSLKDEYTNGRNKWTRVTEEYVPHGEDVCELTKNFESKSNMQLKNAETLAYDKAYAPNTSGCYQRCGADPKCTACIFYDTPNSCYLFSKLKDHSLTFRRYAYTYIRKCNAPPRMAVRAYQTQLLPARLVSGQFLAKCPRELTFDYYLFSSSFQNASLKVIQSEVSPFIGKSTFNLLEDITSPMLNSFDKDKWTQKSIILPKIANADFTPQRVIFEVDNMLANEVSIRNVKLHDNCYVPPTTTAAKPGSSTPGPTTIIF